MRKKSKTDLKTMLVGGFVIVVALAVIIGAVGIHSVLHTTNRMQELNRQAANAVHSDRLVRGIVAQRATYRGAVVYSMLSDQEKMESELQELARVDGEVSDLVTFLSENLVTEKGRAMLAEVKASFEVYLAERENLIQLLEDSDATNDEIEQEIALLAEPLNHLVEQVDALTDYINEYGDTITENADAEAFVATAILIAVLIVAVVVAVMISMRTVHMVSKRADTLSHRLQQQQLMSTISQNFISTEEPEDLIQDALKTVGESLLVDRILLARIEETENKMSFQYSWHLPDAAPAQAEKLSEVLTVDEVKGNFEAGTQNYVAFSDTALAPDADAIAPLGLKAYLYVPVRTKETLWGVLILEMARETRNWDESDIALAEMAGNVIGGVLHRDAITMEARDAESRTQAMFDSTPLACTFFGEDYKVIDCNEEAVRMFGLEDKAEYLERFYGLSPEFQPCGTRSEEKIHDLLRKTFITGREVFEWMHDHGDGTPMPVEATMVRVKWQGAHRLVSYARDVRRDKAQMEEIERTQEELRAARDRAEESASAKTNFLANMSHEIRTPMNAIIGMTNLAQESEDLERIKYCLGKADDAANHLLGIINDILDMSKIEAGKMELAPSDFLLDKMLRRVIDIANFRAEQKHINLAVQVDREVPDAIVADQQRLAQVLTNLLSNAVKFTPDNGSIDLHIHLVEDGDKKCKLLFEVIDTGIGLSGEQIDKLFVSFQQADGSVSRRFGGTGLGLAISKNIIDLMGGKVAVESEPRKGSRFYFTIEVLKGTANYQVLMRADIDWDNVNLLVVDDEAPVRQYFEDIAAAIGVACKTAMDGPAACDLLEAGETFNVIFVDWMMPGMDGIELARHIRERFGRQVIVIMISSVEWGQVEASAKEAGIDRFISKPLLPSRIIDAINECMGEKANDEPVYRNVGENFEGKRVLLVEDVEINREILIASLEGTGIEIEVAENGKIACEKFASDPRRYDLIFMDIHMPEMDGYEAVGTIRSMDHPHAVSIPIVAMTANVFREDVEKCLACGMDDHIGKPIDIDEIINKLKRYL